jgi:hypothetical protein
VRALAGSFAAVCGLGGALAAADFVVGIHCSAATYGAAVAICIVFVAVVEVVIVGKFFVCLNIADGLDPDPAPLLVSFTIGLAGMIDEHGGAVTIDYDFAVAKSKKIGCWRVLILLISKFFADTRASVFHHPSARLNGRGGVASGSMNGRGSNDQAHRI